MTPNFTPGPWHIHDEYLDEVRGPKDEMICATYSIEDERANTHLIAAAPEMYEALKSLLECADEFAKRAGWPDNKPREAARVALAKAQGGAA